MRSALLFFSLVALAASAETARKHPFGVDDWAALRGAQAVALSADGGTVLYSVHFGGEKGPTNTEWKLIGFDGSRSRKLDLPTDFRPLGFTHDGESLYGTYKINNLTQFAVFRLKRIGAKDTPATVIMLPAGVQTAIPSPNGSRYAILADPRPPDPLAGVRTVVEPEETGLFVANQDGTDGHWWCPNLKEIAGGAGSIAWSADGNSIAALSQTPKIGFHYVHSFLDVCSASTTRRVAEIPNSVSGVAWNHGGSEIAFLGTTSSVLTPDHVWTVPASGGVPTDRTPALDASAISMTQDPRGHLWVMVNRGVRSEIDEFRDGALTPAYQWPGGTLASLPVFSDYAGPVDAMAFTVDDPQHASNVAVAESRGLRKITEDGHELLATVELGEVRAVHWTSKEGVPLEGIVTFPADYVPARKYPFLVLPHGGPEANDMLALDAFSRTIAGMGYVVMQPEYRGSTGYGTKFLDAIYQHFGDRAYRDVDSATDYAIAQGWADPNRLAIFGWSAGGFMTSWTVTQTNRYRAAIEGAGITDWASFIWTSDVQQIDYDGRWQSEDPEAFRKFSAVDFASKVTTPLLILHGASDRRVPTFQGQEYFEALLAHGKTVRMVAYPGSPHFPTLWEQRRDVFREISEWLKTYNLAVRQ